MAEDKIVVEIVRDYWTGADERVRAGELVEVRTQTALELVEAGIAKTLGKRAAEPKAGRADG